MDVSRLPAALWLYVQWTLETHGWKLLGAALLFYAGRGRLRELAARRHQQRALAEANGTSYHRFLVFLPSVFSSWRRMIYTL